MMGLKDAVQEIFDQNAYTDYLGMVSAGVSAGEAIIKIKIDCSKHTNIYKTAHGGLLASLADVAMSAACLTLGKKVMTLDMHISWLKTAEAGKTVYGKGKVILDGNRNMVAEVDIVDEKEEILAKARAAFIVIRKLKIE